MTRFSLSRLAVAVTALSMAVPAQAFDIGPPCYDGATRFQFLNQSLEPSSSFKLEAKLVSFLTSSAKNKKLGKDAVTDSYTVLECATGRHVTVTGFSFPTGAYYDKREFEQSDYEGRAAAYTVSLIVRVSADFVNAGETDLSKLPALYKARSLDAQLGDDFGPSCVCQQALRRVK